MSAYNKDGLHYTYSRLFSETQALDVFNQLEKDVQYLSGDLAKIKIYGKSIPIPRQHVAFGDTGLEYTFSGITLHPKPWTPLLLEIKKSVEKVCHTSFNFLLINKYRNEHDCIAFHKDDESDLEPHSSIASVSLGQTRDFVFKRNGFKPVSLSLESGSLLQMLPPTNSFWSHSLPRSKHASGVRLNLTFRTMRSLKTYPRTISDVTITDKELYKNSCFPTSGTSLLSNSLLPAQDSSVSSHFVMKRSAASNASPSKRMCNSLNPALDSAPGVSALPAAEGICLDRLPPHHFSLGGNKIAKVSEFSSIIKVHIRSYNFDGQAMHPSKYGVTMSPRTFFQFKEKAYRISFTNKVYNINKELSVDCSSSPDGSTYCFQKYSFRKDGVRQLSTTPVSLNRDQFQVLMNICDEIWNSVTQLLFGSIFQTTVKNIVPAAEKKK